jgi:hypothetical protein
MQFHSETCLKLIYIVSVFVHPIYSNGINRI